MMRQHHPFSLFSVWVCCCLGLFYAACNTLSTTRTDLDRMSLRGSIELLEEWSYNGYDNFKRNRYDSHTLTRFNANGSLHKIGHYTPNDQEMYWTTYYYLQDSIWIRTTLEINNDSQHPQNYGLYLLNSEGKQTTIYSIFLDSSINYQADVTYNTEGLPSTITYSNAQYPANIPCKVLKTYNKQGQLKTEDTYVYNADLGICRKTPTHSTFTYNEQGDIDREVAVFFNGARQLHSYQYQYDSIGNWTRRTHYQGDNVVGMTKRHLQYFDH